MSLLAYALVTEAEAKTALKLPSDYTVGETAQLHMLINGVTLACEGYASRPFVARSYTETVHGRGGHRLFLRRRPVTVLTSLRLLDPNGGTLQAFTASDYFLDTELGIVSLRYWVFPKGHYNVEAVYSAGWSAAPADVKAAALQWIVRLYQDWKTNREPIAHQSIQGVATAYINEAIPKFVKLILDNYTIKNLGVPS